MPLNICVFCSSSDVVEASYFAAATELGKAMAVRGDVLIYGGTNVGLMGATARAMHQNGGHVVGIIPGFMASRGLAYVPADELVIARDLRERKAAMEGRADAFVALPGGYGTLEEMLEIIALKQLQQHSRPVIFLNTNGFYDALIALFRHMREHRFAKDESKQLYHFAPNVTDVFAYLDNYRPPQLSAKWFRATQV
jgi:uncharacterized protein (TIGR00730 family)